MQPRRNVRNGSKRDISTSSNHYRLRFFLLDKQLNRCNCSRMLWFAAASLMSVPMPINARMPDVRAIFRADDMPDYLQGPGVWVVYVRATVRPDGSLQSCGAETSSGNSKLDAYTCQIIARRAKFAAAKWPDGTPVYGVIRVPVSWAIADAPIPNDAMLKAMPPDVDLTVNKLPAGAQKVVAVEVQVAADENGKIVACEEDPPVKIDPHRHFPQLVPIACQQAVNLQLSPPKDASGKAVRSVQTVSVHFEAGAPTPPR